MSIRKITENTEISPDQYVCGKSKALHAICAPPRKVLRTGGERIYVANPHGEDEGEYFTRATALYLCDTIEEGEALLVISRERYHPGQYGAD